MITTLHINVNNSWNTTFDVIYRIRYNYSIKGANYFSNTTNNVELGFYPSSTWHVNTYTTINNNNNYYYYGDLNEKNKGTMAF